MMDVAVVVLSLLMLLVLMMKFVADDGGEDCKCSGTCSVGLPT
jgi:hypothetical protein